MFKRLYSQGKSVPPEVIKLIKIEKENEENLESGVKDLAKSRGVITQTASKSVNKSLNYGKFSFKFTEVEKGTELNFNKALAGKEYLIFILT